MRASPALRYTLPAQPTAAALSAALPQLIRALPATYLHQQRWFGSKSRTLSQVTLRDYAVLREEEPMTLLTLIEIAYEGFSPELYYFPLVLCPAERMPGALASDPTSVVAAIAAPGGTAFLYEAFADEEFCKEIFACIADARRLPSTEGEFTCTNTEVLTHRQISTAQRVTAEQSNTSIIYDNAFILKSFRKLERGVNPDFEISHFLTTRTHFTHTPRVAGAIAYAGHAGVRATIATLQHFVVNQGDGWKYTLQHLRELYAYAQQESAKGRANAPADLQACTAAFSRAYCQEIATLGRITGNLHNALASDDSQPDFAPEPITSSDVECWIAAITEHIVTVLNTMRRNLSAYPPATQAVAAQVLQNQLLYTEKVQELRILQHAAVTKTRYHGDYHLGQVLKTADGFMILDFEGEPARPLAERRAKHSPLKDVAGMLRSFNYAAYAALFDCAATPDEVALFERWGEAWEALACQAFLAGYLEETLAGGASFLPASREQIDRVLAVFQLDKAIYELHYELNNRPDWFKIPLRGIQRIMGQ